MDSGIMSDMYLRLWRVTCAVKPVWRRPGWEVMKGFLSVHLNYTLPLPPPRHDTSASGLSVSRDILRLTLCC